MAAARGVVGATLLTKPAVVAPLIATPPAGRHPVLRLLGLRHLAEAALLLVTPTPSATTTAVAVDATHAASCVLFAVVSPRHRRPAGRAAGLAVAMLTATWLARDRSPAGPARAATEPAVPFPFELTRSPNRARAHLVLPVGGRAAAGSPAAEGMVAVFPLVEDVAVVIGRDGDADLCLADPTILPRHARVVLHAGRARLQDLGSVEGTRVNGVPVTTADLHSGDRIELGDTTLVYRGEQGS
jgi:hypothetical protein